MYSQYFSVIFESPFISNLRNGQRDVRQVIPPHTENNEEAVRVLVLTQTRTVEVIRATLGAIFRVDTMVDVHVHGSN